MHTILPEYFREKQGCTLYMGIMSTCHEYKNGYNNPVYNAHKNVAVRYTWQNTVSGITN